MQLCACICVFALTSLYVFVDKRKFSEEWLLTELCSAGCLKIWKELIVVHFKAYFLISGMCISACSQPAHGDSTSCAYVSEITITMTKR